MSEICAFCKKEIPSKDAFRYSSSLPFCTFGCCKAFKEEEGLYDDPEDYLEKDISNLSDMYGDDDEYADYDN